MRSRSLLLIAVAAVGCATAGTRDHDGTSSPLWIVNGRVWGHPDAKALHVEGGRIRGFEAPPPGGKVLDALGGWVLPGFVDAHVHLLSAGLEQEGVVLSGLSTMDAVLAAVGSFARAHPDDAWIEGSGWAYSIVPAGSFPSRQQLDAVVADRPVVLSSYDGHTTWVNTKALELAKVDAKTAAPHGGRIIREPDGTPQGTLLEDAGELVFRELPEASREKKLAVLGRAAAELASLGVTEIGDIEHDESTLALLADLEARGELPLRVTVALPLEGDMKHYAGLRERYASPTLRFGFVKGFVDGVVESRTAYLLEPYAGSTERGAPIIPADRLRVLVERAHAAKFPVALHAIGDGAVRISLDAFEAAIRAHPEIRLPHRIEHIEVLSLEDAPRFARLGVLASMQPIHATPEPGAAVWSTNLGEARLPRTFAWRSLLDAKANLVFGSDWPVASPNPLAGIAVATTRRNREGHPPGGWNAHQAIAPEQAVRAYTAGRTLEPGDRADLAILAPTVELDRPDTLWSGHVVTTLVGGRITHPAVTRR